MRRGCWKWRMKTICSGAFITEAAALGGTCILSQTSIQIEAQIPAFIYPGACVHQLWFCKVLSTVRSHRLQRVVGRLAPITIEPIIPQFTSICLPDLLLFLFWVTRPKVLLKQEKCAPLKWLKVYQKNSLAAWSQPITITSTELSDHLCAKEQEPSFQGHSF